MKGKHLRKAETGLGDITSAEGSPAIQPGHCAEDVHSPAQTSGDHSDGQTNASLVVSPSHAHSTHSISESVAPPERHRRTGGTNSNGEPDQPATTKTLHTAGDAPEVLERKVKSVLSKFCMANFEKVSDHLIVWANVSADKKKDPSSLLTVTRLIFETAIEKAEQSDMYARLCRTIMEWIHPNLSDGKSRTSAGRFVVGGNLFRKYLVNRCQEEFRRGWGVKIVDADAARTTADAALHAVDEDVGNERSALYSYEYSTVQKAKRRRLALMRFIGELFKFQLLSERIMHECVQQLLSNIKNPDEEDTESLICLLITFGAVLDTTRARNYMNVYFTRMSELVKNPALSPRIRTMVLVRLSLAG